MEVAELVESKKKTEKKPEKNSKVAFPVEGTINKWGFIHLSQRAVEAFGANKGTKTAITIDLQDDALIVKKV
jgi:hypothetical protein